MQVLLISKDGMAVSDLEEGLLKSTLYTSLHFPGYVYQTRAHKDLASLTTRERAHIKIWYRLGVDRNYDLATYRSENA